MRVPTSLEYLDIVKKKKLMTDERVGAVNIVGFRAKDQKVDEFNDFIAVYIPRSGGVLEYNFWPATTLPGIPWLKKPMNRKGTAILVAGQYLDAYMIGEYRGYRVLKQILPVKVYRDDNQDSDADLDSAKVETGVFGIHIHRAGWWSKFVGVSSAGCQVFKGRKDFSEFMCHCENAADLYGNKFSYTLLDEVDGND